MSELKQKVITPKCGDSVMSLTCKVFNEVVVEVNETGFICNPSGLWEGTSEDWKITRIAD